MVVVLAKQLPRASKTSHVCSFLRVDEGGVEVVVVVGNTPVTCG